jgi:hypothetical protein
MSLGAMGFDVTSLAAMVLDLGLAGLVGLLLWRMGRAAEDPTEAWREREKSLREIYEALRRLVAQAQEDARMLDARLAAQVAHAESTLRSAEAVIEAIRSPRVIRATEPIVLTPEDAQVVTNAPTAPRAQPAPQGVAERVRALADEAVSPEEIARRVDLPIADVRFLLALRARGASPVVEGAA